MSLGDYAYLPDTGPRGSLCRDCEHIAPCMSDKGRCSLAAKMRAKPLKKLEPIALQSLSCKYFELRKAIA